MENYKKIVSLTAFFCFVTILLGQNVNYPTKIIDGTEYYVYKIEPSEGLYRISKKFGVSQSEINNLNPNIHDGLQVGEEILIPKKKNTNQVLNEQTSIQISDKIEYKLHKVEKKQTLFAISRLYNISQDEIVAANPSAADGLHIGDVLRIPIGRQTLDKTEKRKVKIKETTEDVEIKKMDKSTVPANLHIGRERTYTIHVVQPKETLYSLSRQYNVAQEDIIKLNPGVDKSLPAGVDLKIPIDKNNVASGGTISKKTTVPVFNKTNKTGRFKIAFLLPFMVNDKTPDATVNKFLDFYMGALLAVSEMQNNGINYDIYTFDTEKTESKLHSVINTPEMLQMDLIIGPAYTAQIPILIDFAKRREIFTVVPFSSNIDQLKTNPYVFQFNPDKELQNFFLLNAFKTKYQNANLILAEIENPALKSDANESFGFIANRLKASGTPFKKITKADLFSSSIEKYLSSENKNIIIFNTDDYSSIQTYLKNLFELKTRYNVAAVGQYGWKSERGAKPKMLYVSPFIDDNIRRLSAADYESKFTHYYGKNRGSDNPRFDLIGYDITKYFLSLMTKKGFGVNDDTHFLKSNGIQSDFYFKKLGENGGFLNQQLYLIEDEAKNN
ncbi:MAG: LysM peptidoglycan-binding domain-containing protein [Paludibacteraceae bacterium]